MKSCSMIMIMLFAMLSTARLSGSSHALHEISTCRSEASDPATDDDDHRPSNAVLTSWLKSGTMRLVM